MTTKSPLQRILKGILQRRGRQIVTTMRVWERINLTVDKQVKNRKESKTNNLVNLKTSKTNKKEKKQCQSQTGQKLISSISSCISTSFCFMFASGSVIWHCNIRSSFNYLYNWPVSSYMIPLSISYNFALFEISHEISRASLPFFDLYQHGEIFRFFYF